MSLCLKAKLLLHKNHFTMKNKIVDIEALRTIGLMFVLIGHSGNLFSEHLPKLEHLLSRANGTFAVDLFFAISGYIIARSLIPQLLQAIEQGNARKVIYSFWIRRIWRLWPAAWFWLAIMLWAVYFFNDSKAFGSIEANIDATIAGIFNFANYRFAAVFGKSEYGTSFVYWSLSLEEQFYITFPLLVLIFRRHIVWFVALIALVQIFTVRTSLFQVMFRTEAMAIGVLIAIWHISNHSSVDKIKNKIINLNTKITFIVLIITFCLLATISTAKLSINFFGVIAITSGIIVIIASFNNDCFVPNERLKPLFIWVGERTYSIYLIHIPSYFTVREIFFRIDPNMSLTPTIIALHILCATILIISLAQFSFKYVETPLRRRGAKIANSMLIPVRKPEEQFNV